jgi:hypothetical protein
MKAELPNLTDKVLFVLGVKPTGVCATAVAVTLAINTNEERIFSSRGTSQGSGYVCSSV